MADAYALSWTTFTTVVSGSRFTLVLEFLRNNDGYWPDHINDAESIRRSIKFDQIFVSLSGVSVASADSVYAQHMYDYVDMNVGYKFVPLLYKDEHDDIKVTFEFLNDVVEQGGGGAEQFITENDEQSDHNSCL